jgi:hypothetical protein
VFLHTVWVEWINSWKENIYIVGQADVLDETYVVTWHAVETELVVILMADMSLKMNLLDRPKKKFVVVEPQGHHAACLHGYGPTPSLHQLQINLASHWTGECHRSIYVFSCSSSSRYPLIIGWPSFHEILGPLPSRKDLSCALYILYNGVIS